MSIPDQKPFQEEPMTPHGASDRVFDGIADGEFVEHFPDGQVRRRGQIEAGEKSGEWLEYHPNGELAARSHFVNGVKAGLWESFYRDGSPKAQRTFVAGLEEGTRLIWYLDGTTWEENFSQGVKHGVWIERKFGSVVRVRRFEMGQEQD